MKNRLKLGVAGLIAGSLMGARVFAGDTVMGSQSINPPFFIPAQPIYESTFPTTDPTADSSTPTGGRYGLFNLLDSRSQFGTGFFPEPFLVDEGDRDREAAFSWYHQEGSGSLTDGVTGEIEWTFFGTTIEVEAPWETDVASGTDPAGFPDDQRVSGMAGIEIGVRHPVWQYVSPDGNLDNTLVAGFEVAIPSNTPIQKDVELVPQIFDLLRVGDHFGFQLHIGYSTLIGSDPTNQKTLEYSGDFSYTIDGSMIRLPNELVAIVPIVEITGERALNNGDESNNLSGVLGVRFNLAPIGTFAPRLGIGYVLPIDKQARESYHWGVITSLVFDL